LIKTTIGILKNRSESLIYKILLIIGLFFLNSCGQITALLGPAISAGSSGEAYRAAYSYGSDHFLKRTTGKTAIEHASSFIIIE
tara:strand:+ start:1299 stop:1550 length:252 start_codon:yes stop_codon:yes gene_type:complete